MLIASDIEIIYSKHIADGELTIFHGSKVNAISTFFGLINSVAGRIKFFHPELVLSLSLRMGQHVIFRRSKMAIALAVVYFSCSFSNVIKR